MALETSLGCLVPFDLVDALDSGHLLPPAQDIDAGEVEDALKRLEDGASNVVLGIVLQIAAAKARSDRMLI